MADVVDIRSRASGNIACSACGCEWLDLPVNVDAATREIVGWSMRAKCHECGADVAIYARGVRPC